MEVRNPLIHAVVLGNERHLVEPGFQVLITNNVVDVGCDKTLPTILDPSRPSTTFWV